jgi:L-histidine N-alpha-methyltransferase
MPDTNNLAHRRADPAMIAEVREGLRRTPKEISPKYFYDHRGSELFEEITRLPEYYLTRAERAILESWMPSLIHELGIRTVVELGAGSGEKARFLLDALRAMPGEGGTYVPIDVSATFLEETARRLRESYPGLRVAPSVADITSELTLPRHLPGPRLFAFLGSTIGNFDPAAAARLLGGVRRAMRPTDRFLMGADLRKEVSTIEAAYNDAKGVTAEFNRNTLRVLNAELGADFEPAEFEHLAFYQRREHRIEMHLVSRRDQRVSIPGIGVIALARGESIRTEISCKYDFPTIETLFSAAGLRVDAWRTDPGELFALVVGSPKA